MNDSEVSCVYGFEFPARVLTSSAVESEDIIFYVGTQSLKQSNKVYKIVYDDENNLINPIIFDHSAGEIWDISASPYDKNLINTCYNYNANDNCCQRSTIWQMEESTTGNSLAKLYDFNTYNGQNIDTISFTWHPSNAERQCISCSREHLYIWDLNILPDHKNTPKIISTINRTDANCPQFKAVLWNSNLDYHHIATLHQSSPFVKGWDLRDMKSTYELNHGSIVRSGHFNPNRSHVIALCGNDGRISFWDTRKADTPVMIIAEHTHWVWSVRFNPFHDQLVLSCGSDSRVLLSRVASISSETVLSLHNITENNEMMDEQENTNHLQHLNGDALSYQDTINGDNLYTSSSLNGDINLMNQSDVTQSFAKVQHSKKDEIIKCFDDEHEDSVYAAEWSNTDPWIFASLSYDGRICVNRVPRAEKYRILL